MRSAFAVLCLALAGCTTIPKVVSVKVPVPCIDTDKIPQRPVMATDKQLQEMPDYAHVKTLHRDRLLASGYMGELEAAVQGCARLK